MKHFLGNPIARVAAAARAVALVAAAAAAPACGGGDESGGPGVVPASRAAPDLIVVTLDTLRADHLGCYGYFRDTSPHLDALAARGLRFERCYAPIATTLPSHVSLFTASEPLEHGVFANLNVDGRLFPLPSDLGPFAEHALARGYRTAAVVSATPLKRGAGLEVGFEHWVEPEGAQARATESVDAALAWLESVPAGRPVFLWLHLFDPHTPYGPPEAFDRYETDDELITHLEEVGIRLPVIRAGGRRIRTRDAVCSYDGEVRYTDHEVGRLFAALEDLGRADRAAWLVVGDHGEGLGQHGHSGHGQVWREQVRVPLLMGAPGASPRVVGALTAMSDVLPTFLALAGVEAEEFLAERSGRDVLAGGRDGLLAMTSKRRVDMAGGAWRAWTEERWRLLVDPNGAEFLYDLAADPHERENLVDLHPATVQRLRAALEEHLAELEASTLRRERSEPPTPATASPSRLEELRSLGYLDDD